MSRYKPKRAFRDGDLLAYAPDVLQGEHHAQHVRKKQRTSKGVEVVFDEKAHRDFLTGFRRRKLKRKAAAVKQNEEKARKQRLTDRAERRAELKQSLGLPDLFEDAPAAAVKDPEPEDDDAAPAVMVYNDTEVVTTVTMVALNSDSEHERAAQGEASSDDDGDDDDFGDAGPRATAPGVAAAAAAGRAPRLHAGGTGRDAMHANPQAKPLGQPQAKPGRKAELEQRFAPRKQNHLRAKGDAAGTGSGGKQRKMSKVQKSAGRGRK